MNVGRKIQELRRQKNMTQEDLAAAMGVTAAAVSKWENGYTLPDILMLCALADLFEVTTDELLGRAQVTHYAMVAAQSMTLGQQVAEIAREYGIMVRSVYTDYEEAKAAAAAADDVRYLIACYRSGYYGDCPGKAVLVSVAENEEEILSSIRLVFERYLDA